MSERLYISDFCVIADEDKVTRIEKSVSSQKWKCSAYMYYPADILLNALIASDPKRPTGKKNKKNLIAKCERALGHGKSYEVLTDIALRSIA
jgi:hypothetical protein